MNDKLKNYLKEIKDEGFHFIRYFKAASLLEKLAVVSMLGVIFVLGGIIL